MRIFFEIFDYLARGGPLMVPIMVVSLLMWSLILLQLREVWSAGQRDVGIGEALDAIRRRRPLATLSGSPFASLVARLLGAMGESRSENAALLETLVERESERLGRYINYIYVLATIAPLLGLLGTVQGMISTFDAISIFGTGNPRALANGISEALITTQSGLFVSIPGLFMAGFLRRRVLRIGQRLHEFRAAVLQTM
ncbi:MAG: MotA/TolQ/ExbB proton channel family protein [Deltaproteobacteria bacterium]|nr:MotA/TolQ/ExbB proton channel family protein [Deltaproteobacteria bacterium]